MSYDTKCYELAALFLSDNPDFNTEAHRNYLAQHIQDEIEGTIKYILPDIKYELAKSPALQRT